MVRLMLARQKISRCRQFRITGLRGASERVGIDLAVMNDFPRDIGFVAERGRLGSDIDRSTAASRSRVNRRNPARLYALDRRLRNRVSIFAQIVFHAIFALPYLVSPNGPPILKMNNVGHCGQHRQKRQHHKH
ncbi:MAG: hypothetical protein WAK62_15715 [Terriglobales bacterium]